MELLHTLTPRKDGQESESPPREPPITKLYTSSDDHWLAAINCFGDIYVFNLETERLIFCDSLLLTVILLRLVHSTVFRRLRLWLAYFQAAACILYHSGSDSDYRQHWFISRLDGASVAAAGFHPKNNNVLVISTSSNQVFALDVEARELGKWSLLHTFCLPKRYQEFPGEIIGLSFSPSPSSSSVIIYSSRAKCLIEFGKPTGQGEEMDLTYGNQSERVEGRIASIGLTKLGSGNRKRRFEEYQKESKSNEREKFEMVTSKHPVLYLRHLSKSAILVVEKPWMEVIKGLDSQPVHRHIFGT